MLLWSLCARDCRSAIFFAVITKVVSSAYVHTFEFALLIISLIQSWKKVMESVLPCGIPCVMVVCVDCWKYDLKKESGEAEVVS